jgi:hypothetical protein
MVYNRISLAAFWASNRGVVLVLGAMIFGSAMNAVARLMETDGSHGKAMHPFQVCGYCLLDLRFSFLLATQNAG